MSKKLVISYDQWLVRLVVHSATTYGWIVNLVIGWNLNFNKFQGIKQHYESWNGTKLLWRTNRPLTMGRQPTVGPSTRSGVFNGTFSRIHQNRGVSGKTRVLRGLTMEVRFDTTPFLVLEWNVCSEASMSISKGNVLVR